MTLINHFELKEIMKRTSTRALALLAGVLFCALALSQSVPNGGPITTGQVWTATQWNNAWQSKFDVTGGSLTAPTITNPAITGGTQSAPHDNGPNDQRGDAKCSDDYRNCRRSADVDWQLDILTR